MAVVILTMQYMLIALGIIVKKNKFLDFIIMTFLWTIFIFCQESYDLQNYYWAYSSFPAIVDTFSVGFDLLFFGSAKLGISFFLFKVIIQSITLGITYYSVRKFCRYSSMALALMLIYPFTAYITQLRAGLAMAIAIYAILDYVFGKRRKVCFIILMCVSISIHWLTIIYLCLLLTESRFIRKHYWLLLSVVFGVVVILFTVDFYPLLIKLGIRGRIAQYFNFSELRNASIAGNWYVVAFFMILFQLSFTVFVNGFMKRCRRFPSEKNNNLIDVIGFDMKSIEQICYLNTMLIAIAATYILPTESIRLFKNIIPFFLIVYCNYLYYQRNEYLWTKSRQDISILVLVCMLLAASLFSQRRLGFEGIELYNSFSFIVR